MILMLIMILIMIMIMMQGTLPDLSAGPALELHQCPAEDAGLGRSSGMAQYSLINDVLNVIMILNIILA